MTRRKESLLAGVRRRARNLIDAAFGPAPLDGARLYGLEGTIHSTEHVDVELDYRGHVVAVWFRCATLPFVQHVVNDARASEMAAIVPDPLVGVVFEGDLP